MYQIQDDNRTELKNPWRQKPKRNITIELAYFSQAKGHIELQKS